MKSLKTHIRFNFVYYFLNKMKFLSLVLVLLCVGVADLSVHAQKPNDPFEGTWVLSKSDESIVFFISKTGSIYNIKISMAATEADPHDVFEARRNKSKLIGPNKLILTEISSNHLHVSNFYFEGADESDLERVAVLSEFFGIWKSSVADKHRLFIYRHVLCATDEECRENSKKNCFEADLILEPSGPGPTPELPWIMGKGRKEYPCRTQSTLMTVPRTWSPNSTLGSIDTVSIELLSEGKIRVNWKEQNIANTIYTRVGPSFIRISNK